MKRLSALVLCLVMIIGLSLQSSAFKATTTTGLVSDLKGELVVAGANRQFNVSDPDKGGAYEYFHKNYPNFKTKVFDRGNEGQAEQQLTTLIAAGTAPDVFITSAGDVPGLVRKGYALPLDSFLAKDRAYATTLTPVATSINTYKGKVYGITWESLPRAWMINLDIFEKRGIKVPSQDWTIDEMIAVNKKLVDKANGISGMQGDEHILLYQFFMAYGVKGFKVVNGKAVSTLGQDPNAIAAVEKVVEMRWKSGSRFSDAEIASFGPNWNDYWVRGHVGMVPWSLWGQPYNFDTQKNYFKWSALPPPKGPTGLRGGNADSITMSIFPTSKKKDLAFKYIKACTSKHFVDNASLINKGANPVTINPAGFGTDKKVLPIGLPPLNVKFTTTRENQAALDGFVKAAACMKLADFHGVGGQVLGDLTGRVTDQVATGKKSAADMLKEYDTYVNSKYYNN
jgi:ABC-type glycerol-3-phosphate transport system substrate-binding protein